MIRHFSREAAWNCLRQELPALISLQAADGPCALFGLDGYIDRLCAVVCATRSDGSQIPYDSSRDFIADMVETQGMSVERQLVLKSTRMGGNAPISAICAANLGLRCHCVGFFGKPELHPAFAGLAHRCTLTSLGDPAQCTAFEFSDCKLMFSECTSLNSFEAKDLFAAFEAGELEELLRKAPLISLLNWAGIRRMNAVIEAMIEGPFDVFSPGGKIFFFDFSDISGRSDESFLRCIDLLRQLAKRAEVCVSLNPHEAGEAARILNLPHGEWDTILTELRKWMDVQEVVFHALDHALLASTEGVIRVDGKFNSAPRITTGGGDNFNGGYCAGKLAGFSPVARLALGNLAANHYVSCGSSLSLEELVAMAGAKE